MPCRLFCNKGQYCLFFHSNGNTQAVRACLKINSVGLQMVWPHILSIRILMLSWPWALFRLRLTINISVLLVVKLVVRNLSSVKYQRFVGSLLQFFNKEYWLEKKELKSSVFSLKSVIKQFSWNNGGISGNFLLFKKIFNKDQ